jgi:glycogen(starch) synthase
LRTVHIVTRAIHPFGGPGGLERAGFIHARIARELGYRVLLYTSGTRPAGVSNPDFVHDVSFVPWPNGILQKPSISFGEEYHLWTKRVSALLHSNLRPGDIIHVHGAAGAASIEAPMEYPVVLNPHGLEEFGPLSAKTLVPRVRLRSMVRKAAGRADKVISTDPQLVASIRRHLKIGEDKIVEINNVVEASLGDAVVPPRPYNDRVVSIGRLEQNKGYDLLAEAMRILTQRSHRQLEWLHFGSGSQFKEIERIVESAHGAVNWEVISGASDEDVLRGLLQSTVFVQPSRYEGSSLTTIEAMRAGVIVVGTPVGGIPNKIVDGVTGFLSRDVSASCIATSLENALDINAGMREQIILNAYELVRDRYSFESAQSAYDELYKSLG